ncbi:hypothetical protein [Rugosimonospora africana]|uniref:Uncharacterized protein n=1 Tax=Rugosimonospora africana TaxID=556532 RepID=A0A8J3R2G3_9ACTN|nr:hypothetical protein [Rugosimonospora africana]GIH18966.1 hypothetical protein Raf01_71380 [Rugosimonospora africana]
MLETTGAWIAAAAISHGAGWLAVPSPPPGSGGGFDWGKVHPDPTAVPRSDLFYTIMNALMFMGGVAALCGFVAGLIAFGVGPIFGAHIISDRGRSMMWKGALIAVLVGSATTIIPWLISQ